MSKPIPAISTSEMIEGMEQWAKLIEAIAGLVGAVAWPVAVVLAVWLIMRKHRDAFDRLLDRLKTLTYPGGQVDFDAVTEEQQHQVEVLSEQIADSDTDEMRRRQAAHQLAEEAEKLGELRYSARLLKALSAAPSSAMKDMPLGIVFPSRLADPLATALSRDIRRAMERGELHFKDKDASDDDGDDPPLILPQKK
ncbi:hypothetical protein OHA25_56560 [Nonomuraea sp. NBC_00507]|uniref:hypothetical protein n=1 Tax=Nonomuraea sp. NBC_00507 TaxID=2976002 RepID=UPI002E184E42